MMPRSKKGIENVIKLKRRFRRQNETSRKNCYVLD